MKKLLLVTVAMLSLSVFANEEKIYTLNDVTLVGKVGCNANLMRGKILLGVELSESICTTLREGDKLTRVYITNLENMNPLTGDGNRMFKAERIVFPQSSFPISEVLY